MVASSEDGSVLVFVLLVLLVVGTSNAGGDVLAVAMGEGMASANPSRWTEEARLDFWESVSLWGVGIIFVVVICFGFVMSVYFLG